MMASCLRGQSYRWIWWRVVYGDSHTGELDFSCLKKVHWHSYWTRIVVQLHYSNVLFSQHLGRLKNVSFFKKYLNRLLVWSGHYDSCRGNRFHVTSIRFPGEMVWYYHQDIRDVIPEPLPATSSATHFCIMPDVWEKHKNVGDDWQMLFPLFGQVNYRLSCRDSSSSRYYHKLIIIWLSHDW